MAIPFVNSVFHPTDFSNASEKAFSHALVISLHRKTSLTLLNVVAPDEAVDLFDQFPQVRGFLEKWRLLDVGSKRSEVYAKLGVKVRKVNLRSGNVYLTALKYLKKHPADLMVLSTSASRQRPDSSVAQKLSRSTKTMTLYIPEEADGFVDRSDGSISFQKVLIAVDFKPDPTAALTFAIRAAKAFGTETKPTQITLAHVGQKFDFPGKEHLEAENIELNQKLLSGPVVGALSDEIKSGDFDLVVMTTEGRNGILDIFKGSVTEELLKKVNCPLLAVPANILS